MRVAVALVQNTPADICLRPSLNNMFVATALQHNQHAKFCQQIIFCVRLHVTVQAPVFCWILMIMQKQKNMNHSMNNQVVTNWCMV